MPGKGRRGRDGFQRRARTGPNRCIARIGIVGIVDDRIGQCDRDSAESLFNELLRRYGQEVHLNGGNRAETVPVGTSLACVVDLNIESDHRLISAGNKIFSWVIAL